MKTQKQQMEKIDLENDFYKPVQSLAQSHYGTEAPHVRETLDEAGLFLAHLPAHRAMAILMRWMRQQVPVSE